MINNRRRALAGGVVLALSMIQTSFAPHFSIFGGTWFEWVNFVTLPVLLFAVFERRRHRFGWILAIWGGFLLDVYSSQRFFGFWIAVLAVLVFAIKFGIKKYVRIPWYW